MSDAALSPMADQAMNPPFTMSSGLMPKKPGRHSTMSAIFPRSSEPTYWSMPKQIAGLIVYLAM
jgi:hypothetical protein